MRLEALKLSRLAKGADRHLQLDAYGHGRHRPDRFTSSTLGKPRFKLPNVPCWGF